jgi:hypothetical protein
MILRESGDYTERLASLSANPHYRQDYSPAWSIETTSYSNI